MSDFILICSELRGEQRRRAQVYLFGSSRQTSACLSCKSLQKAWNFNEELCIPENLSITCFFSVWFDWFFPQRGAQPSWSYKILHITTTNNERNHLNADICLSKAEVEAENASAGAMSCWEVWDVKQTHTNIDCCYGARWHIGLFGTWTGKTLAFVLSSP